jgi:hypothetical protein
MPRKLTPKRIRLAGMKKIPEGFKLDLNNPRKSVDTL